MSDNTTRKRGVLFDLDGVLLDSEGNYTIFWAQMDKEFPTGIENFASYIKGLGALDFVRRLRDAGIPMAIVTSSDHKKMQALYEQYPEFPTLFEHIITGDMVAKAKPDPECFLTGAKLLGVDIKDCIVFEDSRNGLIAARESGAMIIGLPTTLAPDVVSQLCDMMVDAVSQLSVKQILDMER